MESAVPEGIYGCEIAQRYDARHAVDAVADAVAFLSRMAGGGPALELGVGTGRLAIPLAQTGVETWGIDVSPAMLGELRRKPGARRVSIMVGDFARLDLPRRFTLIYVAFNTFLCLATRERQLQCLRSVAQHLQAGGSFVLEAFLPDRTMFVEGHAVRITCQDDELVEMRYAWPDDIDEMAAAAGLTLRDRWSGWDGQPVDVHSSRHVSVYAPAGTA